jgi:hypothetical protein
MSTIQIKRGATAPSTLLAGELALDTTHNILYGGNGTAVEVLSPNGVAITPSSVTSGGVVTGSNFPSGTIVGISDIQVLTNKRVEKRAYSTTSTATLIPEIATYDVFHLTAQAAALTIANHSTSTPTSSEMILIKILDNGTAQTISFGTNYVAKAGVALPTTTVAGKNMTMLFMWDSNLSKYNLLALGQE